MQTKPLDPGRLAELMAFLPLRVPRTRDTGTQLGRAMLAVFVIASIPVSDAFELAVVTDATLSSTLGNLSFKGSAYLDMVKLMFFTFFIIYITLFCSRLCTGSRTGSKPSQAIDLALQDDRQGPNQAKATQTTVTSSSNFPSFWEWSSADLRMEARQRQIYTGQLKAQLTN